MGYFPPCHDTHKHRKSYPHNSQPEITLGVLKLQMIYHPRMTLSRFFCQVNHFPGSLILHCKLNLFRNGWRLILIYVTLLVVYASFSSHFTDPSLAKLSVCKNIFDKISYGKHHDLTKSLPTLKGLEPPDRYK